MTTYKAVENTFSLITGWSIFKNDKEGTFIIAQGMDEHEARICVEVLNKAEAARHTPRSSVGL